MATIAQQWQGTAGVERRQFARVVEMVREAQSYELPPDELMRQLREVVDPFLIQDALDQAGWEILSGHGENTTAERQRAVKESLRMWKRNPLHQWSVWLWTSEGLGDSIAVDIVRAEPIEDDPVAALWKEFRDAQRNEAVLGSDCIHEQSDAVLNEGNVFWVYVCSNQDSETTISELDADEIIEIVTHPSDRKKPLFYKRQFTEGTAQRTWYYPDYVAYFSGELDHKYLDTDETLAETVLPHGAFRVDTQRKVGDDEMALSEVETGICVQHIAHNRKDRKSLWGWPLSTCARPYLGAQRQFTDARLAVAKSKAAFSRRKQYEGGSRGGKSLIATIASNLSASQFIDTNPSPVPGSTEIDNAGVMTTDLPMTTGAGDAWSDLKHFVWAALLGEGLFPTTAGLDTSRWATALTMNRTQALLFNRYRTFWRTQFERMVSVVVGFAEKFGRLEAGEYTIEVSVDSFSLADFPDVGKAIGQVVRDTLAPMVENGVLPIDAARAILAPLWRVNLQALGINAAGELTSDEAFGIGVESETETPEPGPESALERIAVELERAMEAGDVSASEAFAWVIETAAEGMQ